MVVLLSASAVCGCNRHSVGSHPGIAQVDPRLAQLLRSRTDALLRHMVVGDLENLRQFFPPDAEVNVRDQLRRYLGASRRRSRVAGWDGEQIVVELSTDHRRARTGVLVDFQESGGQVIQTSKIVFNWVSADETCETYHLVPLE